VFLIGVVFLLVPGLTNADDDNSRHKHQRIRQAIIGIQNQIDNIKLTPGPQGPAGTQGIEGPSGQNPDETVTMDLQDQINGLSNRKNRCYREC